MQHTRARHEDLRAETEDDSVPDGGFGGVGPVDHAVVVDGGRRRYFNRHQSVGGRCRLAGDDCLQRVMWEDRIDVEATAEAIGPARMAMGDFRNIGHGGTLGQILDGVKRRSTREAMARFALRRAGGLEKGETRARTGPWSVDLDVGPSGATECLRRAPERNEIWRSAHAAGFRIEEKGGNGCDSGKAAVWQGIQCIRNRQNVGGALVQK
jgi:hypothetical protein